MGHRTGTQSQPIISVCQKDVGISSRGEGK